MCAGVPTPPGETENPLSCPGGRQFQFVPKKSSSSDFVIDVGRTLRRHLLNDVDWVAVVAADLLVVRAEDAVSSPERDDDVAGLRAVIVPAAAAPFGRGQGAQGQRGRVLRRVLAVPPPVLEEQQDQHDDDDDENDAARSDAHEDGHLGADDAGRLAAVVVVVALSGRHTWKTEGSRSECKDRTSAWVHLHSSGSHALIKNAKTKTVQTHNT